MVVAVTFVAGDGCLRQLGKPEGEVDVGARIIDAPVAAVAVRALAEDDAAEQKRAVVVVGGHHPHHGTSEPEATAAAPPLCARQAGRGERRDHKRRDEAAADLHGPSLHAELVPRTPARETSPSHDVPGARPPDDCSRSRR